MVFCRLILFVNLCDGSAGEFIIREGDPGESMYLLKSGSACATKEGFDFEIEYMVSERISETVIVLGFRVHSGQFSGGVFRLVLVAGVCVRCV